MIKVVAPTHYLPIEDPYAFFHLALPKPVASGRDLLVAAKVVSVNPVGTRVRNSKDQLEDPRRILGWDASGVVEALGPVVNRFKVGDDP